jgi:fumarate reductase subunit D
MLNYFSQIFLRKSQNTKSAKDALTAHMVNTNIIFPLKCFNMGSLIFHMQTIYLPTSIPISNAFVSALVILSLLAAIHSLQTQIQYYKISHKHSQPNSPSSQGLR